MDSTHEQSISSHGVVADVEMFEKAPESAGKLYSLIQAELASLIQAELASEAIH